MSNFLDEYKTYCTDYGTPDRLELMLCDLNSVLRGKWLPGDDASKLDNGGVRLPISTYAPNILGEEVAATGLGIIAGDPDGQIQAISGSLKPVPWANGNVAQVQVEMLDETGGISDLSPRQHLANMVGKFHAKGLYPVLATELEFYLFQPRLNPEDPPIPPAGSPNAQNYDLEILERQQAVLNDILDAAKAQGLPTDTLIAEFGPGQFEINFHHTNNVMFAADMALWFRRLVRGVALTHGLNATFMAKPYADFPGNGMHVHASVLDADGANIFNLASGVSSKLKAAVSGVLETMRDMQAIFAPHLNSFRRFKPESFAPSAPDWGFDNRAAAIRLPETTGPGARLEHRISGADVNPYLAIAAILGGILHGLENPAELPLPLDDPKSSPAAPLASDWALAIERFDASDFAADVFGVPYRKVYADVRRDEITQLTHDISPVEYRTYLGRL